MSDGPKARSRVQEHDTLLEPDVILPRQFLTKRNESATGERYLLVAVLDDAIHCFQKNLFARNSQQRRLFREAEEWMLGQTADPPFSFESACRILDLDPEYIRNGLQRWREQQLARAWRPLPNGKPAQATRTPRVRNAVQRSTRLSTRAQGKR
ncbi:MAG TPA: hypothetical protein VL403_20565 [Candidatus Kryptonia bacterium]|nr:hypothetical protein [Candidatus Kryptonia bacterium]